jgi:hypothetical protein
MGPASKEAVMRCLGHLIDESLQQRETLQKIKGLLEQQRETDREDLATVNRRVTVLERTIGGLVSAAPAPAE